MTTLVQSQLERSTAGHGAMGLPQWGSSLLIGCMLTGLGTSSTTATLRDHDRRLLSTVSGTSAGALAEAPEALAGAAISELRRLSGLTWDQLAVLFEVSRRTLHFWASGKPMAQGNEERLQRVLAVVRAIDRGSAQANRTLLLRPRPDGLLPLDLLATGEFERVLADIGKGRSRPPKAEHPAAKSARTPPAPETLVEALQERLDHSGGRVRAGKSVRFRGGG